MAPTLGEALTTIFGTARGTAGIRRHDDHDDSWHHAEYDTGRYHVYDDAWRHNIYYAWRHDDHHEPDQLNSRSTRGAGQCGICCGPGGPSRRRLGHLRERYRRTRQNPHAAPGGAGGRPVEAAEGRTTLGNRKDFGPTNKNASGLE